MRPALRSWVETDRPRAPSRGDASTFEVHGHHNYALVEVECLMPGEATAYDVRLDGVKVWPEPASPFPPSLIEGVLVFGSQRRHRRLVLAQRS